MNNGPFSEYKILYVDDEEKSLKYFAKTFKNRFNIVTANNAISAIDILAQLGEQIAILVTDQRMPEKTGVDLLQHTRANYPHIIRILTTAYTEFDSAIAAVNKGQVYRYILKPWNLDQLRECITDAVRLFVEQQYTQKLLTGKREAVLALAGSIAHELRTPLLAINSYVSGIGKYLPLLFACYDRVQAQDPKLATIPAHKRLLLENAPDNIMQVINQTNYFIDMSLMNARDLRDRVNTNEQSSVRTAISKALANYPYQIDEIEKVTLQPGEDFTANIAEIFIMHMLYNLLKNSFYALKAVNKGDILIWLDDSDSDWNKIYFKDTGAGIDQENLPYIFDDFFSSRTTDSAAGIGLGFCKRLMHLVDGDITCDSVKNEYTIFTIYFPKLIAQE